MTQNSINNTASQITAGDVLISTNVIASVQTNQDLTLSPNGTGQVSISGNYSFPAVDGTNLQILETDGAGNLTFQDNTAASFTWSVETGTTATAAVNTGTFLSNAGGVVVTLPATAAVGDSFQFVSKDAGGFTIDYSAGQSIQVGSQVSTTSTGSVVSAALGDWIELVCDVANDSFICNVRQGNVTVA